MTGNDKQQPAQPVENAIDDSTTVSGTPDGAGNRPREARQRPAEIGGPKGPEPTRYGDWERNGRCSDF